VNPLQTFVDSQLAGAIGWALLHSLWQGALIASLLGTVLLSVRSPRVRYAAAGVAMLAAVTAFAGTFFHFLPTQTRGAGIPHNAAAPVWHSLSGVAASAGQCVSFAKIAPWLAPLWLVGVIFIYARTLAGSLTLRRMRRRGVCSAASHWQEELGRLAMRVRVSRSVELLESCFADAPIVIGHFRPVILVPLGLLSGLPPAQIETILLHELAHICRHDFLVNSLQRFVEGLLFYHPAIWWISSVMRRERENCCDDAVVAIHPDKHEYARALAALEHHRIVAREAAIAATGGRLMNRIRRLISPEASRSSAWASLLAASVLVAAVAVSATAYQSQSRLLGAASSESPMQVSSTSAQDTAHDKPAIRVGAIVMQANLVKMVPAVYPLTAKNARISGTVVLKALVGADGKVADLRYVSGPPLLMRPAMEAVQQWEYKPVLLNGNPVRVDTQISVDFDSDGNLTQTPPQDTTQDATNGKPVTLSVHQWNSDKGHVVLYVSDKYSKWLDEDVVYIIDDAERAAFLGLKTDEEREKFIEDFWQRRDSASGSADKGFKQEHYRRIAYANQQFGSKLGDSIPGWRTDRGHMYIVYGPPDQIDSHPTPGDGGVAKELWLYHHVEGLGDNLTFTFADRTGHGDYRLAPSPASGTN